MLMFICKTLSIMTRPENPDQATPNNGPEAASDNPLLQDHEDQILALTGGLGQLEGMDPGDIPVELRGHLERYEAALRQAYPEATDEQISELTRQRLTLRETRQRLDAVDEALRDRTAEASADGGVVVPAHILERSRQARSRAQAEDDIPDAEIVEEPDPIVWRAPA